MYEFSYILKKSYTYFQFIFILYCYKLGFMNMFFLIFLQIAIF